MNVDDEGKLLLVRSKVILEVYRLDLRESLLSREVRGARVAGTSLALVSLVLEPRVLLVINDVIDLTEVNAKVPVQINTGIGQVRAHLRQRIHILASGNDLVLAEPVRLDVGDAINVEDGKEHVLVLVEQLLEVLILHYEALVQQLEHLIVSHGRRDHLSRVSGSREQYGWLLTSHDFSLCKYLVTELARVNFLRLTVIVQLCCTS